MKDKNGNYIPKCNWCRQPILQSELVKRITVEDKHLEGDFYETPSRQILPNLTITHYAYHPACYHQLENYLEGKK